MKNCYLIMCILIISFSLVYGDGNEENFELGAAIYRDLNLIGANNHWHGGVFSYFEYSNGFGTMYYVESGGAGDDVSHRQVPKSDDSPLSITVTNYQNNLLSLKTKFKNKFKDESELDYNGAFTVNSIAPSKRESIVATSRNGRLRGKSYTWIDMLDVKNHWCSDHVWTCEHWNGTIDDIDEIRCDGVIEFSYEKNEVDVSNGYNIGHSGQTNVDRHNNLHVGDYNWDELCPKIQAGESHFGGGNVSTFQPLISSPPTTTNFAVNQYYNNVQLSFKISDNASVKSYVLIQVKKTSEPTWHVLKDKNNNVWKFKKVDLTDYQNNLQHDYFYIPWEGKYVGGQYPTGTESYNVKITVIDQGANYSENTFNFSATWPPLDLAISGPNSLSNNEHGTFTATPIFGSTIYVDYRWWERNDDNGGAMIEVADGSQNPIILAPPGGTWLEITSERGNSTIQRGHSWSFSLKCEVTDSDSAKKTDIHPVNVINGANYAINNTNQVKISSYIPEKFELKPNFPNPFNPVTHIAFNVPEVSHITLDVFNVSGQKVATLVNGKKDAGVFQAQFNGVSLASGVYVYRFVAKGLESGKNFRDIKRMLLIK